MIEESIGALNDLEEAVLLVDDERVLLTSPRGLLRSNLALRFGVLCSSGSVFPTPISGLGSLAHSLLLLWMSFLLRFGL